MLYPAELRGRCDAVFIMFGRSVHPLSDRCDTCLDAGGAANIKNCSDSINLLRELADMD